MTYVREKDFQAGVIEYARLRGWLTCHFGSTVRVVKRDGVYHTIPDSNAAGFPDLVLARKKQVVFAELKLDSGRLSPAQKVWLGALEAAGQVVYVWRPRDWDEIQLALD